VDEHGAASESEPDGRAGNGDRSARPLQARAAALVAELHERFAASREPPQPPLLAVAAWPLSEQVCLAALAGELDMSNSGHVGGALDGRLGPQLRCLVVDLSGVSFMDSSGISELMRLSRLLKANGGVLILAAPTAPLARLFELVNLGHGIAVVASLSEALERAPGAAGAVASSFAAETEPS